MQTLNQFQYLFNQFLDNNSFSREPGELYEPASYIMNLGGKRLRPLILLLGHHLFSDDIKKAMPAAMAIEIFHNFSLIHDDIMDAAPLRRGKPTVHSIYGLNAGILSGDVMLVLAYRFLLQLEDKAKIPVLMENFTEMAMEVCEGQQMDMNFESKSSISISEYLKMIELKTSVLVACALKMGALLGGATDADANHLYHFGRNLGIAFQIQDDILDSFGDPHKFGKKSGGDIVQNKKTILYLKALELADEPAREELRDIYSNFNGTEEAKIERVKQLFERFHVRKKTENLMDIYQHNAFQTLEQVAAAPEKKLLLKKFAQGLMQREF